MSISIKSNLVAQRTIRNLSASSQRLTKSFEKLSSGLRINHAADDAAGLAVSESLKVQSRIRNRGRLNVNDGQSALQVAEGATTQIGELLTRMSELAQQAANGTYSSTQRLSVQREFLQLDKEIRRIAETTKFNGVSLLRGSKSARSSTQLLSGTTAFASPNSDGRYATYYNSTTGKVEQRDNETGLVSVIATASGVSSVQASGNGETIAFDSTSNLTGANSNNRTQVFTYDRRTGTTTQITNNNSAFGSYTVNAVSADGSTVLYTNTTMIVGYAISAYNTQTQATRAITTVDGQTWELNALNISANGQYVSLISNDNLAGANGANDYQVYSYNLGATNPTISQITSFSGDSIYDLTHIQVSSDGKIYFVAGTNLGGTNPSNVANLFEYNTVTGNYRNLSNSTGGISSSNFVLSPDGSILTLISDSNITGENSGGYSQAFQFDFTSNAWTQKTNFSINTFGSFASSGTLSGDGNSLVYGNGAGKTFIYDISLDNYNLNIEAGTGAAGAIGALIGPINGSLRGLGSNILTTQSGARGALDNITLNIQKLANLRGLLGASLSRLNTANNVLSSQTVQLNAAQSRIADADIATESSSIIKNTILQQVSTALLAQANQQPNIALKLLDLG